MRLVLLALIAITLLRDADAERLKDSGVHILCLPDPGFFQLKVAQVLDMDNQPGYYTSKALQEEPIKCTFQRHEIEVSGNYQVDGKGYCGALHGAYVSVTINGQPLTADLVSKASPSSASLISKAGTFDTSGCFDHAIEMTISEGEGFFLTKVCLTEPKKRMDETHLIGRCETHFHGGGKSPFLKAD